MARRSVLPLMLLCALPISAAGAQSMPVSVFLPRAEALKKMGVRAMLSPEAEVLKDEVRASANALRAEVNAARKAGRKPEICAPETATITPEELLSHLRKVPQRSRRMPIKLALKGLLKRKYPCG